MARPGLYANIHAKRKRGGKMRKKGAKGAPKASIMASPDLNTGAFDIGMKKGGRVRKTKFSTTKKKQANKMRKK